MVLYRYHAFCCLLSYIFGPQTEEGNVLEDTYPIMMSARAINRDLRIPGIPCA